MRLLRITGEGEDGWKNLARERWEEDSLFKRKKKSFREKEERRIFSGGKGE